MTRPFAWLGAAAALLAAGLLGAWLASRDAGHPDAALAERLEAIERRLAGLEDAHHEGAAAHASVAPAGNAMPTPAPAASAATGIRPPPATPAQDALAQATLLRDLGQDYEREPRDAAWAARAEHALTGAASAEEIANANLVPTAFASRCRSRRCRIAARFDTRDQAQEWAYYYMTRTAGTLRQVQFFIADAPGGGVEITLYGQR